MSHLDLGLAPRISQTGVVDGVNASKSILAKKVRPFHSHMDGRLDGWMDGSLHDGQRKHAPKHNNNTSSRSRNSMYELLFCSITTVPRTDGRTDDLSKSISFN